MYSIEIEGMQNGACSGFGSFYISLFLYRADEGLMRFIVIEVA